MRASGHKAELDTAPVEGRRMCSKKVVNLHDLRLTLGPLTIAFLEPDAKSCAGVSGLKLLQCGRQLQESRFYKGTKVARAG